MKKMGRKLIAGTAFAAAALTIGGCGVRPPETVYGPPEWFESETAVPETGDPLAPPTAVTEPETTEPETGTDDPAAGVYGPPEWFE